MRPKGERSGQGLASLTECCRTEEEAARFEVRLRGQVQGVGFRPFVYRLAKAHGLGGFVRNSSSGLVMEVEGSPMSLEAFSRALGEPPARARVSEIFWRPAPPRRERTFRIERSEKEGRGVSIPPDLAPCDLCLKDLRDPGDRRFHYPFLSCTDCGPRFTLVDRLPYDRPFTAMRSFPFCPGCREEYEEPLDRRFHAEPIACPHCGPALSAFDSAGPVKNLWPACVGALRGGKILALKGVGGFQLAVDARNEKAVAALRERKHRPHKPFALMAKDLEAARKICELSEHEARALLGLERPILLLRARQENGIAASVAPGAPVLGVMLPSSPLHALLLDALDFPLVMTSGNREGEPIEKEESEARENLAGMADLFLSHNRPIRSFCDDSVARLENGRPFLLRRARGYAPSPIPGIFSSRPLLAVGAQLKNTFCLTEKNQYVLSQHLGDLDSLKVYEAFEAEIRRFERLFSLRPEAVAHDLHPDYRSTLWARAFAKNRGLPLFPVQHHHAHMASCLLENGLEGDCLGVVFDGSGYGEDGTLWGGEFLVGGYRSAERKGRIRPLPLLGGAQAMREPWRMALAWLEEANVPWEETRDFPPHDFPPKESALLRGARGRSAFTSSAGRLFDAASFLLTGRERISYEGQAAVELEWLAARAEGGEILPYKIGWAPLLEIDTRPMAVALWERRGRRSAAALALSFHLTLARALADLCGILREETDLSRVALSGGVFANGILSRLARAELEARKFVVYCHATVPPNDGGISLGQAAVAAARTGES